MSSPPLPESLGAMLGRIPSGIFILTACGPDGRETGLLASWVQQASFDPPMVTVAVNRKRFLHDWLAATPQLVLNVVGDGQKQFLKQFGAGFGPEEPAFEGCDLRRSPAGLPVLADALGYLEGSIVGRLETGDHIVYAVQITAAGTGPEFANLSPWVHVRKNGLNY
jgi:flavin reductase (DIM6/NTAB) family NADH-FMN oxidoreductase RutF